jgi:hypothetical protein
MTEAERHPRTTRALRVGMLVVIAIVALTNAIGWVDADLWIPFVCIIAVMGVGTRGGPVDALSFVLIEAAVVLLLGVATFSASRDAIWAASVAVSVLAIGKIALVELHRRDLADEQSPRRTATDSTKKLPALPEPSPTLARAERAPAPQPDSVPPPAPMSPQPIPAPRVPAAAPADVSGSGISPVTSSGGEMPTDPTADVSAGGTRKRRTRDDPTPKSVRLPR